MQFMRLLALVFVVSIGFAESFAQAAQDRCGLFRETVNLINSLGVATIETDSFDGEEFRSSFLNALDPHSIVFDPAIESLIDSIHQSIREDPSYSYCSQKDALASRYRSDLESTVEILERMKSADLDFGNSDSIYLGLGLDPIYFNLGKVSRCEKYIKFGVVHDLMETTSEFDSLNESPALLHSYIDSTKNRLIGKEIDQIKELISSEDDIEEKIYNAFVNSLLVQYDQFSYAFSEEEFSDFKEMLSTHSKRFGFRLETNIRGEVVIASVLPGSYAWRSGSINAGDQVIALQIDSKKPLNTKGLRPGEVSEYLASASTDKLSMTLRKADQTIKRVELYREEVENVENSVQAFILDGAIRVGYMALPAFYTSWDDRNASGCAQDVGRAIYALKKENIESLIIDLRNNGGGSITEAIELAGIFIDFGTFLISRNRNGELTSLKDFNKGTFYSGPLALLVNNHSASASEMVAAVLQDYNRALIIGDTTYGKSTGQTLLPIDSDQRAFLKLTTNKYYRVTGHSYYNEGIVPDIILPGYHSIMNTALNKKQSLSFPGFVEKKTYYKPLPSLPVNELANQSENRQQNNWKFQKLHIIDGLYHALSAYNGYLPLDINGYYAFMEQREAIDEVIDSVFNAASDTYSIELLPQDEEEIMVYKYYADLFTHLSESIVADPYIEEVYKILTDYKTFKKN